MQGDICFIELPSTDPLLLFNEFMGVIKGCEGALDSESGFLDRSTYENLSNRAYPVFAGRRNLVYDLFLRYLRLKPRGFWDPPERLSDKLHCRERESS